MSWNFFCTWIAIPEGAAGCLSPKARFAEHDALSPSSGASPPATSPFACASGCWRRVDVVSAGSRGHRRIEAIRLAARPKSRRAPDELRQRSHLLVPALRTVQLYPAATHGRLPPATASLRVRRGSALPQHRRPLRVLLCAPSCLGGSGCGVECGEPSRPVKVVAEAEGGEETTQTAKQGRDDADENPSRSLFRGRCGLRKGFDGVAI